MASAQLDAAIGDRERVLLDSSVVLSYYSPQELAYALARHVLERIESDGDALRGYISVVTASEVLVRPLRGQPNQATFMHHFLEGYANLTLLPVDLSVAIQAATLRAATRLATPDALIIASGLLAGCEILLTNDSRWKQRLEPLFPQFQWLYLGDYL